MTIAQSKLTSQGQISVPADVRKRLGLSPGSVLEWYEEDGRILVRRVGKYTSEDIHKALFGSEKPRPHSLEELKEGVRTYIRNKHAVR